MKKIWIGMLMAASALGAVQPSAAQERWGGGRRGGNDNGAVQQDDAPRVRPDVMRQQAQGDRQLSPGEARAERYGAAGAGMSERGDRRGGQKGQVTAPVSPPPAGTRGIAVGEPNPSAPHDRDGRRGGRIESRRDGRDVGHDVGRDWNRQGDWRERSRESRSWQDGRVGRYDGNDRWDRNWRNDHRYDWRDWRGRYSERYREGRYDAPRGWAYGYRRLNIGIFLSSMLYDRTYWIDDPYYYRLPPAYGPYRWVRYYDDALLIDVRTGYVVDVVYRLFW